MNRVERIARNHLLIAGKIHHWDKNERGKLEAHAGLGKDCDTFKEQQGITE